MSESNSNGHSLSRAFEWGSLRTIVTVEPPRLGHSVILRQLSVAQWAILGGDIAQQLAFSIVDANGQRIYTSEEDIKNLAEMPADIGKFLVAEMVKLNGASQASVDAVLKNSEAILSTASVSV